MSTFVLVHGAGHGAWCWELTERDLAEHGHRSVSLDLPLTGLEEDAATVRDCLDTVPESVILVGHSYGGLVISKAAGGRSDIEHLVYVAAILVGADENIMSLAGDYPASPLMEKIEYTPEGFMVFSPETTISCLYNETPVDFATMASTRMRPTAALGMATNPGADPWRSIPTTYIVCERDRTLPPELQRAMATKAGRVESIDTDHSPFASRPEEFYGILAGVAGDSA
jgi:pimeloyl-ACP methyl ester carboxylesterase